MTYRIKNSVIFKIIIIKLFFSQVVSICENFIDGINTISEYREKTFIQFHIKTNTPQCALKEGISVFSIYDSRMIFYKELNDKNNLYIERINNNSTTLIQIGIEDFFINDSCMKYSNKDGSFSFSNCTLQVQLSSTVRVNFSVVLIKNHQLNFNDTFIDQYYPNERNNLAIYPHKLKQKFNWEECATPECPNFPKKGFNDYQFKLDISSISSKMNINFFKAIMIVRNQNDLIEFGYDISQFFSSNNGSFIITMDLFPDLFDLYLIFNTQSPTKSANTNVTSIEDFQNNDKITIIKKNIKAFMTFEGNNENNPNTQQLWITLGVIGSLILFSGIGISVKFILITISADNPKKQESSNQSKKRKDSKEPKGDNKEVKDNKIGKDEILIGNINEKDNKKLEYNAKKDSEK